MRLHIPALTIVALLVAPSLASLSAQSLADVARREEERRKSIKAEAKVYTNKDLEAVPSAAGGAQSADQQTPGSSSEKPASADAAKPTTGTEESSPEAETRDQAYWSERLKALQSALDRNQVYLDALQSRINGLQTDFVNRDDPAQRAVIVSERTRAQAEFERLKLDVDKGRRAIADLHEEARRANVPPGWLR